MDTEAKKQTASSSILTGKCVLFAEDCQAQQLVLSHWLRKAGMIVVQAKDGREVIELASREPFDAVLLDMQMPQIDGYEAARQLRRQGYRGPILALTGATFGGDEKRCLEAGCDAYLAKPVAIAALLGALLNQLAATSSLQSSPPALETLEDLSRRYVSGLSRQTAELRTALAAMDRSQLERLAHKMRGAAGMYGFRELAETAHLLEEASREGQDRELLGELLDEIDALVQEMAVRP